MPSRPTPRTSLALAATALAAAASLAPNLAAAQAPADPMTTIPGAESFDIRYYLTTKDGKRGRAMAATDFQQFVNQARCECGHQIETQIRLKPTNGMAYSNTAIIQAFVGTNCGPAESNPVAGQFRRCVQIRSGYASDYVQGTNVTFHPIWLSNGISLNSETRDPKTAIAAGTCSGVQGSSGVWMCGQTNAMSGCQADEFFISGTQANNLPDSSMGGITFDFQPPLSAPTEVKAASGDSAVVVSWTVQPGDINGFRVLCEEVATGKPPPGKGMDPPALDKIPNGTLYYTKDNLCPQGPFSTVAGSDNPLDTTAATTVDTTATTDDTAGSDGTTGTTDDTGTTGDTDTTGATGTTTTSSTTTTGATGSDLTGATTAVETPPNCGDNVLQADEGEQCDSGNLNGNDQPCHLNCQTNYCGDNQRADDEVCDNGPDNGPMGLCNSDCTLNVSEGMLRLDWNYVCSDHLAYNTKQVRIEGLENGKEYNFLLVAYDKSGNPLASPEVIRATPVDTNDLWEECHDRGDVCGRSGFCNVAERGDPLLGLGALLGLGLGLGGLIRRRSASSAARTRA